METRANYVIIGLFTVLVTIGAFGAVFWLAVSDTNGQRTAYDIVFRGSVTGLTQGAAVLFNGLRVGEVGTLGFDPQDPTKVVARVIISEDTPMREDTRARLEYQGLTGVAYIQMISGDQDSPPLVSDDNQIVRINAESSAVEDLIEGTRDILDIADVTLRRLENVVATNEQAVNSTIRNMEQFSLALSENSVKIDSFIDQIGGAAESIGNVAASVDEILGDNKDELRGTFENITLISKTLADSRDSFAVTLKNVEDFSASLGANAEALDDFLRDTTQVSASLGKVAVTLETLVAENQESLGKTIENFEKVSTALANNAEGIDEFLANSREISQNLNRIAGNIDGVIEENREDFKATVTNTAVITKSLADNSDDIATMVSNISQVAKTLNTVASRVDALTEQVAGLVSGDGQDFFEDAAAAARSVRSAASELELQIGSTLSGLSRLSGRSVSQLEAFLDQSRRTVNRLDGVLSNIERNPSRFFFNGDQTIPEYGRGRR